MNFDPSTILGWGVVIGLIGVVWNMLRRQLGSHEERMDRIDRKIDETASSTRDLLTGKNEIIYASKTRLDELDKRLDKLETNLVSWMRRIEDKLDELRAK